jgi:putative aldouronate transport system permease protein
MVARTVSGSVPAGKKRRIGIIRDILRNPFSYLLLLPAVVYTFLFGYATLPYMVIAFENFNYKTGIFSHWVWLKNFQFFFSTNNWWVVTGNTLRLNFLFIIVGTLFALLLSLLLNEIRHRRYAKTIQTVYLFPSFISWVIVSYMVYALFGTQYGLINNAMQSLGVAKMKNFNWYARPEYWTQILVVMRLWKGAGMGTVIYLAAITGIDGELYEAAIIDGANRFQRIRHITIPLLLPTMAILTLMDIGKIFYGDFGMIYAVIGDSSLLYSTTDVIDTYVFRALRKTGDPSIAMAVGLYQSLIGFLLVFGVNAFTRRYFPEGALF